MTPMMQQYLEIKERYKHCILFYRLGDFYEMFFEDAITVSRELNLTLTGRECGEEERAPMCGVPHHSADTYINKLIKLGYKVAICEQTEVASKEKKLVNRDVRRVVTKGTNIENDSNDGSTNTFLVSIYEHKNGFGLSYTDVLTGQFITTLIEDRDDKKLFDELSRINAVEIISNRDFSYAQNVKKCFGIDVEIYDECSYTLDECLSLIKLHFKLGELEVFSQASEHEIISSGALISYLQNTQKNDLSHITKLEKEKVKTFMHLDMSSRRNLELSKNMKDQSKKGTLLDIVDYTFTKKGERLLRECLEKPLTDINLILERQNAVSDMKNNVMLRDSITDLIKNIIDVDRILAKITYGSASGRDLIALKQSLSYLPQVKEVIESADNTLFEKLQKKINTHKDIYNLLEAAIQEEQTNIIKDGELIKKGYNKDLDQFIEAKEQGTNWLLDLENLEREKTGIKGLKVKFNKVFGYFIEITNKDLKNVPERYQRRQTMSNCERYMIDELKEIEEKILGADEKISLLERAIFAQILETITNDVYYIKETMECISIIDFIISLAISAEKHNFVCPTYNDKGVIDIKGGFHPVVAKYMDEPFIPNDTYLDLDDHQVMLITGPNMAGKSTYMRQVALISILFQIGAFVPADAANLCVVDRVFTRVGASDDLWSGQSTFMVEMNEVSNIINNATNRSLLILDEVGRGTSTFDGVSIAWSIVERIADKQKLGAKTLFATHYHELTEIETQLQGVLNYHVTIKKTGEEIVFLRKIERGFIDHSYGLYVAKLAGIPEDVVDRAKEILQTLENKEKEFEYK